MALLAASVASSPIEILNYQDAEAGHGQVMSGIPGEAVTGEFYWNVSSQDVHTFIITTSVFRRPRVTPSGWCTLLTWAAMWPLGSTCP